MNRTANLTNHFLIAMPGLQDSNFFHTVTYICEHNEQGAMGIVLNRPTDMQLNDILDQLDIGPGVDTAATQPIFSGGPVQGERGFVLHTGATEWDSTMRITAQISVTTSRDILQAIATNNGPEQSFIALGYAGWGAGQLEDELGANAWLSGPATPRVIFELPPTARWAAAAQLLGVDLNLISGEAGHA